MNKMVGENEKTNKFCKMSTACKSNWNGIRSITQNNKTQSRIDRTDSDLFQVLF